MSEAERSITRSNLKMSMTLLFVATLFNYIDRSILGVLTQPIKAEFSLSDTQIGLLSGLTFALFYAALGLPFARWADLGNRRHIMAVAVGLWSVATALCGLAGSFMALFLLRVGVGIGEAAGTPTSHALAADYYPPARRAIAATVLTIGGNIGQMLGFGMGGYLGQSFGWRSTFIVLGAPGLVLAVILALALYEPRRLTRSPRLAEVMGPDVMPALRVLCSKSSFIHIAIGFALWNVVSIGTGQFLAPFMMRSFHVSISTAGFVLALMSPVPLVIGSVIGGCVASRLTSRDLRWLVLLPAMGIVVSSVLYVLAFLCHDFTWFVALSAVGLICLGVATPPLYVAIYGLTGSANRALGLAIVAFVVNFVGYGLGPITIGLISDALEPLVHAESLRYSLLAIAVLKVWAIIHFCLAARTLSNDMEDHAVASTGDTDARAAPSPVGGV